jgi:hypothetical protein
MPSPATTISGASPRSMEKLQACAITPVLCFLAARGKPHSHFPPPPSCRGRAGRQGSLWTHGPRRLATSRLVETDSAASPPSPMASRARCLIGLLRSAPGGLTFQATILSFRIVGRLTTALGPGRVRQCLRPAAVPAIAGPSGARLVRRDVCGFNRRAVGAHLRRHVIPRPPLPVSCLEMLDQTPLGNETGCPHDKCARRGGDKFLANFESRDISDAYRMPDSESVPAKKSEAALQGPPPPKSRPVL